MRKTLLLAAGLCALAAASPATGSLPAIRATGSPDTAFRFCGRFYLISPALRLSDEGVTFTLRRTAVTLRVDLPAVRRRP